jgi:hypothetical protein
MLPEGPPADRYWENPLPLEPGDYQAFFAFEQANNLVPYVEGDDKTLGERAIEGLWTGRLETRPLALTVTPPTRSTLQISGAGEVKHGEPCVIQITISNPKDEPLTLNGRFDLQIQGSRGGHARLWFRTVPDIKPITQEESFSFEVPARGTRTFAIDVAEWPLPTGMADGPEHVRLHEAFSGKETTFTIGFWPVEGMGGSHSERLTTTIGAASAK